MRPAAPPLPPFSAPSGAGQTGAPVPAPFAQDASTQDTPAQDTATQDTATQDSWREDLAWPFAPDAKVLGDRLDQGLKTEVMLVDLSGLDWPAIEPLVSLITSMAAEKAMVPVLVVDCADVLSVRRTGLPYDTLPDVAGNTLGPDDTPYRDWPAYVAQCRQLLAAKWQPTAIVHLGTHAEW